jgi:prolyl oligopeptidase
MPKKSAFPPPPPTRKQDLVEELHGVKVADPYRWLEESGDPEVKAWVEAQNRHARALLESFPERGEIRRRVEELLSVRVSGLPVPRKGRYFFTRREPSQQQGVLYVQEGLKGAPRVLVDPNPIREDATVSLDWWQPSRDGRMLAYGISEAGNERATLRVMRVDDGKILPDTIPHARHSTVAWLPDASGFYYTRNPAPGEVAPGDENYYSRVFFHRMGADPKDDPLVWGEGREKTDIPEVSLSPDGRFLLLSAHLSGAEKSDVYVKDLKNDAGFVPVIAGETALSFGQVLNDAIWLTTNLGAPNYRLFRVDPAKPARKHWKEILPESDAVLQGARVAGGRLVAMVLRNAVNVLRVCGLDGKNPVDVPLPGLGTIAGTSGEWDGKELFFYYVSFNVPGAVYRLDVGELKPELFESMEVPFRGEDFEVEQVWVRSKDGTKVSMFVGRKKGLPKDGKRPVLVTGYGGFNIGLTPYFSPLFAIWMEAGGLFGLPNLRGGSEYGENWHKGGMLGNKQNVFDDFHASGEWFVENGWSTPDKMVAWGGSNGGTLVGAALTQRPDLFGTIVCDVPVLDMLRYHRFLLAKYWMGEYGDPDNPQHFNFLHAYSPYHRVKESEKYPAVFVGTAESDARVDPMHARKFAARLQAATRSGRPVLFWEERRAGHGMGTPLSKRIEDVTDRIAFAFRMSGVKEAGAAPAKEEAKPSKPAPKKGGGAKGRGGR